VKRLAFLTLLLCTSMAYAAPLPFARIGGSEWLIIYGDSRMATAGGTTATTTVDDLTQTDLSSIYPSNWTVRNYSRPGAYVTPRALCNSQETNFDGQCRNGQDRAVRSGGTCNFAPTLWGGASCIEDLEANPAIHSMTVVLAFGANDVRSIAASDTAAWATKLSDAQTAYEAILDAMPDTMECVLEVPAPIWSNQTSPAVTYTEANDRISNDWRPMVQALASAYDCAVSDAYSAVLNYEASNGTAQMLSDLYDDCTTKGGVQGDGGGTCPDGVHWDLTPVPSSHPVVDSLNDAVFEAARKRKRRLDLSYTAPSAPAPASNTRDSGVWDTAEWGA